MKRRLRRKDDERAGPNLEGRGLDGALEGGHADLALVAARLGRRGLVLAVLVALLWWLLLLGSSHVGRAI